MPNKIKKIEVEKTIIHITEINNNYYINLTDMLKYRESGGLIFKWLSNKNTIEFLGTWEKIYNSSFNYTEFGVIMSEAGVNRFTLSVKEWIERTNAIGIFAKAGRYGGTYAHKDIAFELGSWISAEFKLLIIREFQRLKETESKVLLQEWNISRMLAKVGYQRVQEIENPELAQERMKEIYEKKGYPKDWIDKRLRGKHRKYLPFAFTKQGVAMLSAVLRSDRAIKASIQIMDAFVDMRHILAKNTLIMNQKSGAYIWIK